MSNTQKYLRTVYRINNKLHPEEVMQPIRTLLAQNGLECARKLWQIDSNEIRFPDVRDEKRKPNSILRICKKHPCLSRYYSVTPTDIPVLSIHRIQNFTSKYQLTFDDKTIWQTIDEVIPKIPRVYRVSELRYIFDGLDFYHTQQPADLCHQSQIEQDDVLGAYIEYNRSIAGNEKHSFVIITTPIDEAHRYGVRDLAFALYEKIPGRYEGARVIM